jgi:hypothetical protein
MHLSANPYIDPSTELTKLEDFLASLLARIYLRSDITIQYHWRWIIYYKGIHWHLVDLSAEGC